MCVSRRKVLWACADHRVWHVPEPFAFNQTRTCGCAGHDPPSPCPFSQGDKIRYFFESDAFDAEGNLTNSELGLCLNKIGHALHELDDTFKAFTHLPAIRVGSAACFSRDWVPAQQQQPMQQV